MATSSWLVTLTLVPDPRLQQQYDASAMGALISECNAALEERDAAVPNPLN